VGGGDPVAREILTQPAFDEFNDGEISPARGATDDEILDWVARDAETAYHPSCTARMGIDQLSVVDPLTMRVHGVEGLSLADCLCHALRDKWEHLRAR
jgi:choline dehydrogenase